ncbi:MAG: sulfotransferase [Trueperaceae bacterium]
MASNNEQLQTTPTSSISKAIRPPIIIIGMHRSGTSMMTSMLRQLGLFIGASKDNNDESNFFQRMNDWSLRQAGGSWDNPEMIDDLLANETMRQLVTDYFDFSLHSPRQLFFLDWRNYLQGQRIANLTTPWGWKDPRNTYTLPLWLDLFPDAKVIHIYRNGIDVAESLRVRWQKDLEYVKKAYERQKPLFAALPKLRTFPLSVRCSDLEQGFKLWELHLERAQAHVQALGDRAIEIKYEDFLTNPFEYMRALATFSGLEASDETIRDITSQVRNSRGQAYKKNPELLDFKRSVNERLERYGYS